MNDKCTIVVSSCDRYSDVWDLFFAAMKKQWKERKYPIVLNTESIAYDYEDMNIRTFSFYKKGQKDAWGRRLKKTLKKIESDYILFFLDDFILLDKVDEERLEQCIRWMDENQNIASFCFYPAPGPNITDERYKGFERRPQKALYRLNCQVALWRRKRLIKFIKGFENPWQWEINGSIRSYRYKELFYSQIKNDAKIFDYTPGGVIWRGRWIKSAPDIASKYLKYIDFDIRGFIDENNPLGLPQPYSIKKAFPKEVFSKKFWFEISKRIKNFVLLVKSLI